MTFLVIILAIAVQVFLTAKKVSPILSLLVVAIIAGFFLGMQPAALLSSIEKGVGNTLGGLALILCLGAILGRILEVSGAAERIATTLIKSFGEKNVQWAVALTGFLIGIPLYYNAGFVILVPLIFSVAQKTKLPLLYIAIPMAAALSTTHCFLPPHPSPVVLVNAFHANTGKTLIYGLIIALPAIIIAGPFLGRVLQKMKIDTSKLFSAIAPVNNNAQPPVFASFFFALLPVLLIIIGVLANAFLENGRLREILSFTGDSNIALLLAVLSGLWYFGLKQGKTMQAVMQWVNEAISGIAVIILIITAGGIFKQVLIDSGTGTYIASLSGKWQMPPLLFAWIITALLRVTLGSATVAGLTAAGIVAPLVATGQVRPELMVLAVGAGSVFGSHINDPGFWMYKEFFKLSLKQTFLSWTIMETLISVIGLAGVLLLQLLVN